MLIAIELQRNDQASGLSGQARRRKLYKRMKILPYQDKDWVKIRRNSVKAGEAANSNWRGRT